MIRDEAGKLVEAEKAESVLLLAEINDEYTYV
ncbi:MAG: hypothetical protein ACJAQ6_002490 [Arenicella sp.]|jgi:hypothetical protein